MADETDVEESLVGLIAAALYPQGTSQASAAGVDCRIQRGWPSANAFELAKAQGVVHVSVAARAGVERNTSRYPCEWQTLTPPAHTLTATAAGNAVTIGGTVATPQNVMVLDGLRASWSYAVQPADTTTSIATGLATLIAADRPGTASAGPVVTVAGSFELQACVASVGTSIRELKRQDKSFRISVWAPPAVTLGQADQWRTNVVKAIEPALSATRRVVLPDGATGLIRYERTVSFDQAQEEGLYRRDLYYWVEYPTTEIQTHSEIGAMSLRLQGGQEPADAPVDSSNFRGV